MSPTEIDARTSTSIDPTVLAAYASPRQNHSNPSSKPIPLITSRSHPSLPISIHNYTFRAFKSLPPSASDSADVTYTHVPAACRSLITETHTGLVVARSFSKFFNYHEKGAYKPTGSEFRFVIEEKLDGSLIMLFHYQDEWRMASRTSFEGPHVDAAWRILREKGYGGLVFGGGLDKEKTERRFGAPSRLGHVVLPSFPRPKPYIPPNERRPSSSTGDGSEGSRIDPSSLSKLERDNEEGFVVKFWRTPNDTHPQRMKIKFQAYLQLLKTPGKTSTSATTTSATSGAIPRTTNELEVQPPSPSSILQIYITTRTVQMPTSTFLSLISSASLTSSYISKAKENFLSSVEERFADDYGGDAWLKKVEAVWDRIDGIYSLWEDEWRDIGKMLQDEGFYALEPGAPSSSGGKKKKGGQGKKRGDSVEFRQRIMKKDIDPVWRPLLLARFGGGREVRELMRMFVDTVTIPNDLRSTDVIMLDS